MLIIIIFGMIDTYHLRRKVYNNNIMIVQTVFESE